MSNTDLIAEARNGRVTNWIDGLALVLRLADALEASDREREVLARAVRLLRDAPGAASSLLQERTEKILYDATDDQKAKATVREALALVEGLDK